MMKKKAFNHSTFFPPSHGQEEPCFCLPASSKSAPSEAIENLKNLNTQLLNEVAERRQEIQHLQRQLAVATERVESATADLNAMEMRLIEVVKEKNTTHKELEGILQLQKDLNLQKVESENKCFKKWIYGVAATTTLCAATAIIGFCWKPKN